MAITLQTLAFGLALSLGAFGPPKDPDQTTERIARTHQIRVGVAENPPWVRFEAGQATGVEPMLIRRFAALQGAQVQWVRGGEGPLLKALENGELDLVAGGLDSRTPWKSKLGVSRAYFEAKWIVAVPEQAPAPDSLKGLRIAAPPGAYVGDKLRRKGAQVAPAGVQADWSGAAIYDFLAPQAHLKPTKFILAKEKHIIAAAPGENQLLLRLDRFLMAAKPGLERSLEGES